MNREKEKEIAGIIQQAMAEGYYRATKENHIDIPDTYYINKVLSLFPEFKVEVDCPVNHCHNGIIWGGDTCETCNGTGKVLTDLADGVKGEIIEVKGE